MAVNDIKNNLQVDLSSVLFTTNGVLHSEVIDTEAFELGYMVVSFPSSYTDGSYTYSIEDSDSPTSGFVAVDSDKVIGDITDLDFSGPQGTPAILPSVGLFSNRRYVRVQVTSSGVTTGASIQFLVTQKSEIMPVG